MRILPIKERPADWDKRVGDFATKTLFHESAWHAHLLDIHPRSAMEYFSIEEEGTSVGLLSAQRVRKLIFRICGSPMPGTGTNYMGPAVNRDVNQSAILAALVELCRSRSYAHLELTHDWLDPVIAGHHGFAVQRSVTHVVPLPEREGDAWDALTSSCRNRVRKAMKAGLEVEATDDPSIADRYYEQFVEVYGKQGMVPPYGVERPRSLVTHLAPADRLFAVWVKHEGEVIATGLFPHDEHCVYFWGGASWLRHQSLCPNDLLHWTVMRLAIAQHIPLYDMCGGTSQFKNKFGGADVPHNLYSRSFVPLLRAGRRLYASWHFGRLRLGALLHPPRVPRKTRVG